MPGGLLECPVLISQCKWTEFKCRISPETRMHLLRKWGGTHAGGNPTNDAELPECSLPNVSIIIASESAQTVHAGRTFPCRFGQAGLSILRSTIDQSKALPGHSDPHESTPQNKKNCQCPPKPEDELFFHPFHCFALPSAKPTGLCFALLRSASLCPPVPLLSTLGAALVALESLRAAPHSPRTL